MKTITHLYQTVGLIALFTRTHRLFLDPDTSVVIRSVGMSSAGGQAFAVLFKKRNEKRADAALFLDYNIGENTCIPFAFIRRKKGTAVHLYRTNRRGRVVGIRAAFRPRLEELMKNWDFEIQKALHLKRSIIPVVHLAAGVN